MNSSPFSLECQSSQNVRTAIGCTIASALVGSRVIRKPLDSWTQSKNSPVSAELLFLVDIHSFELVSV